MKLVQKLIKRQLVLIGVVSLWAAAGLAAIIPPAWVSADGVVSVTYRFENGDTNPAPSEATNLFAAPQLSIDKVTFASGGWANPDPLVTPGAEFITRNNGGVWEIGETGHMDMYLPLITASNPDFYVNFFIEVIAAQGIEVLPVIQIPGVPAPYYAQEVIEPDPYGMFSWVQLVSTGQVSLAASPAFSFNVTCLDVPNRNVSSAIDQIKVYAQVIPEPTVDALLAVACITLLIARRKFGA